MSDTNHYYTDLAAAFVRGKLGVQPESDDQAMIEAGRHAGLRLHKFKRQAELPRVRKVIGILHGLAPASLLDIGSGRGTFLWPLLSELTCPFVLAVDLSAIRVSDIDAVRRGGLMNLTAAQMDATSLALADDAVDVVTALEVLEHLAQPARAAAEAVRVARRFVISSVPSKEDDNPEHIQLFNRDSFTALWLAAGAQGVKIDYVLNHMIAVARV